MGSTARVVTAFAPGRVNLIGEHTDYNDGLSLPFATAQGVWVTATPLPGGDVILARALDLGEEEQFTLPLRPEARPEPTGTWTDFVRGALNELAACGRPPTPIELEITGNVPQGGGLSSSAALEVALCLALLASGGEPEPARNERVELARLCSRIESDWAGSRTGLLDQLASLCGSKGDAIRIDFRALTIEPVALQLGSWRLITVDSGEPRSLAASGYNERRAECERARKELGLESLRDARLEDAERLGKPLNRRVRHVIEENARVEAAIAALRGGDLSELGCLLDASHASLRDLYDTSTEAVEQTVRHLKAIGAAGARMMGGGFGGHVLALLRPEAAIPDGATPVAPSKGARVIVAPVS